SAAQRPPQVVGR
ncbi:hypothetical protein BN1708_019137, partial [Verticillium longisporum]